MPLIHFSTDYVFDGGGARPWREDDATGPLSVYGASKLAGEEAIRAAGGPHLIVRTSWVYAATGANFLRTIARLARERDELRIVADQIGAPTSARLIADAVAKIVGDPGSALVERFRAGRGLVNVAAAGETSWHGFATAIVEGLKARHVALRVQTVRPFARRTIRPRRGGLRTPGSTSQDCAKCSASKRRTGATRSTASSTHWRLRSRLRLPDEGWQADRLFGPTSSALRQ